MGLRARLALSCVVAAAVGYGLLRDTTPPPSAAPSVRAAPRCRFEPGDTAAFVLETEARAHVDDQAHPDEDRMQAVLSVRAGATRGKLDAALTEIVLTQALSRPEERVREPLTASFELTLDERCRITGFAFDPKWSPRARQLVATWLKTYEFALPDAPASSWQADQTDGLGDFVASYTQRSDRDVTRAKLAYDTPSATGAMSISIEVFESRADATFGRDGRWLATAEGRERVRIRVKGAVQADLEQRFLIERDDARYVAPAATDVLDGRDPFALEVDAIESRRAGFDGTHDEVLAQFEAMFANGDESRSFEASERLAAQIAADPALAQRLLEALREGRFGDIERAALYLALELSDAPAAAAVLREVIADHAFAPIDRARAVSALSDHGDATMDKATLLRRLAEDETEMVASVGMLALGNLAARADGDGDGTGVRESIRHSLGEALDTAEDLDRELLVVDAIGNARDATFADALSERLQDPRATMRTHAVEAIAGLGREVAEPALLAQLGDEPSSAVAGAIARALRSVGARSEAGFDVARQRLAAEPSARTRAHLVDWLGHAGAQSALIEQFHRESNVDVLRRIGRFVPAEALR